ncbi:beta propeller repeat protein [Halegenticoccus soli]|uniref:PQQ-binding-like beta-propeller repeat protein n=1 Tax=Halegenticoccus soli TaxID=1985678 RepID=UPI000C6E2786|nr:PQQ-binding-like beta-propeller repeat protein [Halegenticoccus soli]
MVGSSAKARLRDFWTFYRRYAKSGVHAASTAALTGLGLLTFVHRGFAAAALAAYLLPPLYLYVRSDGGGDRRTSDAGGRDRERRTSDAPDASERAKAEAAAAPPRPTDASKRPDGAPSGSPDAPPGDSEAGAAASVEPREKRWTAVDVPTDRELFDVACADGRAFAVGDGGVVLVRETDGWRRTFDEGPAAESNALRGADAVDGGGAWFAGDGGAVARYDPETGRHADYSAPNANTSTWEAVAAAASGRGEAVYLANGSGAVLRGEFRDGEMRWGTPTKPGSGSSVSGVEFVDAETGYVCDTNAAVFETADGGANYEPIGVDDPGGTLADVAAAPDAVSVAVDDGTVVWYDGAVWTRVRASESGLSGICRDGDAGLACGRDGTICARVPGGWEPRRTPVDARLNAVSIGEDCPHVAVGAEGTVLEYR